MFQLKAKPTVCRPCPRSHGLRPLAVWLGAVALLGQLLLPLSYEAAAAPAQRADAYAEFVRSFGAATHLCAVPAAQPGAGGSDSNIPAHDPLQCPLCQSFVVLAGLLPPAGAALALPASAEAQPLMPRQLPTRARTLLSDSEARGPPPAA
ncbi:MAG: DUF2946 family protein [Alphaproteobacteria bacterium]